MVPEEQTKMRRLLTYYRTLNLIFEEFYQAPISLEINPYISYKDITQPKQTDCNLSEPIKP